MIAEEAFERLDAPVRASLQRTLRCRTDPNWKTPCCLRKRISLQLLKNWSPTDHYASHLKKASSSHITISSNPERLELYYYLRLTRECDNAILRLYKQGKIVGGAYTGYWERGDRGGECVRARSIRTISSRCTGISARIW